eukprot:2568773-Heterocapsa_arctica.AAC.1
MAMNIFSGHDLLTVPMDWSDITGDDTPTILDQSDLTVKGRDRVSDILASLTRTFVPSSAGLKASAAPRRPT